MSFLKEGSPSSLNASADKNPGISPGVAGADQHSTGRDAPVAEPKAEPQDDFSSKFAALSRKERDLLQRERAFKERESRLSKYEEVEKHKSQNPMAVLETYGITFEQLLDHQLKETASPEDKKYNTLEETVRQLKAKLDEEEERKKQDGINKEIDTFRQSITKALDGDNETFALIKSTGSESAVFDAVREAIMQDPESYQTRADAEALIPQMAAAIEKQLEETLGKVKELPKVRRLLGIEEIAAKAVSDTQTQAKDIAAPEVTLTNKPAVPTGTQGTGRLSQEESKRNAAKLLDAMMKGTVKIPGIGA